MRRGRASAPGSSSPTTATTPPATICATSTGISSGGSNASRSSLRGGRGPVDRRARRRERLDGDGGTAQARPGAADRRRAGLRRALQPRPGGGHGARRRGRRHPARPRARRASCRSSALSTPFAPPDARRSPPRCANFWRGGAGVVAAWSRSSPTSTTRPARARRWSCVRRHRLEAIAIQISAPDELAPRLRGDLTLRDVETGETRELTISPRALGDYARRHALLLRGVESYCRERAIPCFALRSDQPFDAVVLRMFRAGGLLG